MRSAAYILILAVVASFLYFFALGDMPLTDPDETFYAQTSREMLEANEWITPQIFGKPQFEKPVLYYWLVEASFKVFGVNEFAARFPSALFGVLGVIGIYFLGRLIFSPLCGFLSALIMSTSVLYLTFARSCVTDMVLGVFTLFCLLFFMYGWQNKGKVFYFLSAAMAGLAVLTKGPIGLFLPGMVILIYVLTGKRWAGLKNLPIFSSIVIFLLVALPWYVIVIRLHREAFMSEFIGFHNLTRFIVPEHKIGSSPFFYIPVILGGMFPWTAFLAFGAWDFFRRDKFISNFNGYKLFLVSWFLVVFLFFSISRTKLVTYIFPLFPVLAVITGRFWERFLSFGEEKEFSGMMKISYYFLMFSAVAFTAVGYLVITKRYTGDLLMMIMTGALFFTVGTVFSYLLFLRGKKYLSFYLIILLFVVLTIPAGKWIAPVIATRETSKKLIDFLKDYAKEGDIVGGEDDHRRGIAFYANRKDVVDIHGYEELMAFVQRKEKIWGILQAKHFEQVKERIKDLDIVLVAAHGKYLLITNKPKVQ